MYLYFKCPLKCFFRNKYFEIIKNKKFLFFNVYQDTVMTSKFDMKNNCVSTSKAANSYKLYRYTVSTAYTDTTTAIKGRG